MPQRRIFVLIYGVSGAASLVYEVVWLRLLTLQVGHTVAAVSTVLAAFMGGLAIGAAVAGRYSDNLPSSRAFKVYGMLELAIGAAGALLPFAMAAVHPLLEATYGGALFGPTRLFTALLSLTLPTLAMGATYPIAIRAVAPDGTAARGGAAALYAANTIGATTGAAAAGFLLLPAFGLIRTSLIAVTMNVLVAAAAFALSRRAEAADATTPAEPDRARPIGPRAPVKAGRRSKKGQPAGSSSAEGRQKAVEALLGRPWLAATALGISGFAALSYEVSWTRVLALVLGPTTYAFSAMLVAFIGGIAIGSSLMVRAATRIQRPAVWLGFILVATAAGGFFAASYVDRMPLIVADLVGNSETSFNAILRLQAGLAALLLMPMTIGMGAAFPVAIALATANRPHVSRAVAIVYALNTAGAIAGSLACGFAFIPLLGLERTIVVTGLLLAGAGLAVIALATRARLVLAAAGLAVTAVAAFAWWLPRWDVELLSSGAYKYATYLQGADYKTGLQAGDLLYYAEGSAGTVTVRRLTGSVSLAIDGKVDASNGGDMLTQRLLAHVPLLLHPDPKKVGIIGLGSGVTLGSALKHPISRADVMEISPEVVRASSYFKAENYDALADPRTKLLVTDGRSHLMLSGEQYDVIISEPSNPWMAGIAALFTREFFTAARNRLAPNGILCQWAHTYDISADDLRSIVATFSSVFPNGTMWLVGDGDLLLVSSTDRLESHLDRINAAFLRPGVAADLSTVGVKTPFHLLSLFVGGGAGAREFSQGAVIQSDDRMALEFSGPRNIYMQRTQNAERLRELATKLPPPPALTSATASATAADWRTFGEMEMRAEAYEPAFQAFSRAVTTNPHSDVAVEGLLQAAAGMRNLDLAIQFLQPLANNDRSNSTLRRGIARALTSNGKVDEALGIAHDAVTVEPTDPQNLEQVASILVDVGDVDRLAGVVNTLLREYPDRVATQYFAAALHFLRGEFDEAARLGEAVVQRDPGHSRAQNLLGGAYTSLGRNDLARRAFQASVRANPRDSSAHVNLGVFEMGSNDPSAAAENFAEALSIDPESAAARTGLADALEQQGLGERAARVRLAK